LPRLAVKSVPTALLAILLAGPVAAQQAADQPPSGPEVGPAPVITSIRVVQERSVPAIEILASAPLVPQIHSFDTPPHLLIDLPARLRLEQKPAVAENENILGIRTDQSQTNPPLTHIVVDLRAPYGYSWDAAGNRVMVRLKPMAEAAGRTPGSSANAHAEVVPVASEPTVPTGNLLRAGSSLAAGSETAILHLSRGGEVHVCPGTSISVMPSPNRRDLMLSMNTGSLETHYTLDAAAHSVMTPDFRILFAGPGMFDFAISADAHGNTCVRALKGNASSALVTELMGERFYQVKPQEQVVFRGGQIDQVDDRIPLDCGCPPPPRRSLTAETAPPPAISDVELSAKAHLVRTPTGVINPPASISPGDSSLQTRASDGVVTPPLPPPPQPSDTHVKVDVPFVFTAKNRGSVPLPPAQAARDLPVIDEARPRQVYLDAVVTPPPPKKKAEHRGFFGHIKGVFGALFR